MIDPDDGSVVRIAAEYNGNGIAIYATQSQAMVQAYIWTRQNNVRRRDPCYNCSHGREVMIDCCETEEVWDDDPNDDYDPIEDEYYDEDCGDMPFGEDPFYDPGGRFALRAKVRNLPCPTCGQQTTEKLMTVTFKRFSDFVEAASEWADTRLHNLEDNLYEMRIKYESSEAKVRSLTMEIENLRKVAPLYPQSDSDGVQESRAMLRYIAKYSPEVLRMTLLDLYPNDKIAKIKAVRAVFACGLKEAKEFVEGTSNSIV